MKVDRHISLSNLNYIESNQQLSTFSKCWHAIKSIFIKCARFIWNGLSRLCCCFNKRQIGTEVEDPYIFNRSWRDLALEIGDRLTNNSDKQVLGWYIVENILSKGIKFFSQEIAHEGFCYYDTKEKKIDDRFQTFQVELLESQEVIDDDKVFMDLYECFIQCCRKYFYQNAVYTEPLCISFLTERIKTHLPKQSIELLESILKDLDQAFIKDDSRFIYFVLLEFAKSLMPFILNQQCIIDKDHLTQKNTVMNLLDTVEISCGWLEFLKPFYTNILKY